MPAPRECGVRTSLSHWWFRYAPHSFLARSYSTSRRSGAAHEQRSGVLLNQQGDQLSTPTTSFAISAIRFSLAEMTR